MNGSHFMDTVKENGLRFRRRSLNKRDSLLRQSGVVSWLHGSLCVCTIYLQETSLYYTFLHRVDQWPQHLQDQYATFFFSCFFLVPVDPQDTKKEGCHWLSELKELYIELTYHWFMNSKEEEYTYESVQEWTQKQEYAFSLSFSITRFRSTFAF